MILTVNKLEARPDPVGTFVLTDDDGKHVAFIKDTTAGRAILAMIQSHLLAQQDPKGPINSTLAHGPAKHDCRAHGDWPCALENQS